MTDRKPQMVEHKHRPSDSQTSSKRRKLSHEILGLLGISLAIAVFLLAFLSMTAVTIAENYCDHNGLILTYTQTASLEMWIYGVSLVTAVLFFIVLFLFLLGQKIAYVRNLTEGVEALRAHRMDFVMPLEGNNELTQLAETINYLSATERQIREKERALQEEKEQLIRTLSHDIRTPLTSIISYSELLLAQKTQEDTVLQEKEQLELILRKAEQIKELTDILLDGGKRSPEFFEDARLLMEQLAAEMEESLEEALEETTGETTKAERSPDACGLCINLNSCPAFSGTFDVGELRRIFDNLTSNILKYADLAKTVTLEISIKDRNLVICQCNTKRTDGISAESHHMGLASIRRIAHNYGGTVEVRQDESRFTIKIILSEF